MHFFSFTTTLPSSGSSAAFWPSIAVIAAAVVAGLIALIGHLIAKSNTILQVNLRKDSAILNAKLTSNTKIADMRQDWINRLRDDLSKFVALIYELEPGTFNKSEIYQLAARIKMFMNPRDPDYPKLANLIDKVLTDDQLGKKGMPDPVFVSLSQAILKREWDQLKKDLKDVIPAGLLSRSII